jgi:hypothetical protein
LLVPVRELVALVSLPPSVLPIVDAVVSVPLRTFEP